MMLGPWMTLLLLLAAGTVTVKGDSTTVPTRGDGFASSPGTTSDQGSNTTVSTTGGSSTTVSTTEGVSPTDSTVGGSSTTEPTTEEVTTTDCPPGDRWRLVLQGLLARLFHNGDGPTGARLGPIIQALLARRPNNGRRPAGGPRGGFHGFRPSRRYPRGLKIYDLIRGNGGISGPTPTKPTRPTPTEPTGQNNDLFDLAAALGPDGQSLDVADAFGQDFKKDVLQKLDTIDEEVKQVFRLLPRIIAERSK